MSEVKSQKSEVNARVEYARFSRSISVQQKSTPSLDFIATPEPNSQQEFLTYPNSIAPRRTPSASAYAYSKRLPQVSDYGRSLRTHVV